MTKLELMERQVIKSGRWPAEWLVRDVANAVMELAENQVILEARLELAQRYAIRRHAASVNAHKNLSARVHGIRERAYMGF